MMKLFLTGNVIEDWINALIEALNDYVVEPILGSILNLVGSILNMVWALLCNVIYGLISIFFDVLITIPRINILENVGIEGIYQRVTLIIVIVMTFYITFEVVKYVVQPDTVTDKEKGAGNIAFRLIIVILLIAFVPKIFSIAYDLQAKIISSNVIGKVIFGTDNASYDSLGGDFAANTFSIFYQVNPAICNENTTFINDGGLCPVIEDTVEMNLWLIRNNWSSNFSFGGNLVSGLALESYLSQMGIPTDGSNGNSAQPMIKFQGLLAIIVGVYILWTLIVYGVEVARRYFQLIFLQITAPIAIISYVSPKKDGAFQKWVKQCTTTYLDLFIRLAVLYFILLIMNMLHDAIFTGSFVDSMLGISEISDRLTIGNPVVGWIYIFLIIGLLQFLKKAPKLLKELLPSGNAASGEFGMSGKEMIGTAKQVVSGTSRAVGGVVGGFRGAKTAINSNTLKGGDKVWTALSAGFQGAKAGFSKGGGIKKASEAGRGAVYKAEDIALAGGDVLGATFRGNHYAQEAQGFERASKGLDDVVKGKSTVSNTNKETKVVGTAGSYEEQWKHNNIGTADSITGYKKAIEKASRVYAASSRDAAAQDAYKGSIREAVSAVYQSEIDKYDLRANAVQRQIDAAKQQNIDAVSKIDYYDSLTVPLTAEQQADRAAAVRQRDATEQKIEDSIQELEQINKEKAQAQETLNEESTKVSEIICSKITEAGEEAVYDEVQVALNEARKTAEDAEYRYVDASGNIQVVKLAHIVDIDVETGIPTIDPNAQNNSIISDPAKFASKIGDIETAARKAKSILEASDARKRAKANADASGKSGK